MTKAPDQPQLETKIALDTIKPIGLTFEPVPLSDSTIGIAIDKGQLAVRFKKAMLEFYKKRNYEYAWISKEGLLPRTNIFFNMMDGSGPNSDTIHKQFLEIARDTSVSRAGAAIANLETSLTMAFLKFANKEWEGNDDKLVEQLQWYIPRKRLNYQDILDKLLEKGDTSLFNEQVYRQYGLLKRYLSQLKKIEDRGGWPIVTLSGKSLRKGDTSHTVSDIKKRMAITQDYDALDTGYVFNPELATAIALKQKSFGLAPTGRISKPFLDQLNVPVHKRAKQIIINMERCRWVPVRQSGDYLVVNIPEFKLHAYHDDSLLWDMDVVVGKATNKTIIFSGNLKYIVFNPYWHVTQPLFYKEIIPILRRNPGYIAKEEMELFNANAPGIPVDPSTVDWSKKETSYSNYHVVQKPGNKNALGKVKFLFPNEYNIYLHDTPAKSLFGVTKRSFSHGCIRVSDPPKLAQYLLRNDPAWKPADIKRQFLPGKEKYVVLKQPVPVFIAYFTTWVDRQGKINFREDIYGHDEKMAKLIIR